MWQGCKLVVHLLARPTRHSRVSRAVAEDEVVGAHCEGEECYQFRAFFLLFLWRVCSLEDICVM